MYAGLLAPGEFHANILESSVQRNSVELLL